MRQTVLVVEDDVFLRRLYRQALGFADFDVFEAGDGYTALQCLDSQRIDLLILDLGLPILSGQVVLAEIAARPTPIPVVVVTGTNGDGVDRLRLAGLIKKPAAPEHVVQVVRNCLGAGAQPAS